MGKDKKLNVKKVSANLLCYRTEKTTQALLAATGRPLTDKQKKRLGHSTESKQWWNTQDN